MITVKNVDTIVHVWCGQTFEIGEELTIDETKWASSSEFLAAIATGKALIGNGITHYSDVNTAINFFKGLLPSSVHLENVKTSGQGNLIFEQGIFTGASTSRGVSLVTPDLGDRTTWYQKSSQVTNETLTDSGDGLTFTSAHPHWINIYSLKVTYTHKQIPKRDGTFGKHADWAITIKVDGSTVTTGFTINYPAGTVTFNSSKSGSTITATYWHNDGVTHPSEWLLVPGTGKKLVVEHAELQFSSGMAVNDTIRFEIWAGANLATYGSFPDYLFEAGYGQMRADYRDANDLINTANLGQGEIPKFGSLTKNVTVIPFNYLQAFCLSSAQGAIFRVVLTNDTPYTDCDICTGTFYTQIDNI